MANERRQSQTDRNPSLHKTATGQTKKKVYPKKGSNKIYEIRTAMLQRLVNTYKALSIVYNGVVPKVGFPTEMIHY